MRLSTDQLDSAPATVPSKFSGWRDQVLTSPKEKSRGARICEALRVMNPFESTAGRNTCRSMAPFWSLPSSWALAGVPTQIPTRAKMGSATGRRREAGLMKLSGRGCPPALETTGGRSHSDGGFITLRKCVSKANADWVILCASRLRPPRQLGPDRIVRLASEAGFEGLAVDASCPLSLLRAVASEGLRSGLPVAVAGCPLATGELGKGKRLPHLAAFDDPEERAAAVKLATSVLEAGGDLQIGVFLLDFGAVALRTSEAELRLRFARREMEEGDPGHRVLRRALEERKAKGGRLYDACRGSLEPLLAAAERRGLKLCLPVAHSPWQLPSPREAQLLLREFAGAPLAVALSPARRAILEALGLAGPPERWQELHRVAGALEVTDQVGLEGDLLPGLGELELSWPAGAPAALPAAIGGQPDATFKEVLRARRRLGELATAAAEEKEGSKAAP
jgi:hypothetical protein